MMSLHRMVHARRTWAPASLLLTPFLLVPAFLASAPAAHAGIGADDSVPEAGAVSTTDSGDPSTGLIAISLSSDMTAAQLEPTPTVTTGSATDGLTIG